MNWNSILNSASQIFKGFDIDYLINALGEETAKKALKKAVENNDQIAIAKIRQTLEFHRRNLGK